MTVPRLCPEPGSSVGDVALPGLRGCSHYRETGPG